MNTGKTFAEAAKIVERDGATEIYAVASHGLFAGAAAESLDAAPIKEILVTDSVATKERLPKNIKYLSASKLIADAIIRIHEKLRSAHYSHITLKRINLLYDISR